MRGRTWKLVIYIFLVGFILNLAGIVSHAGKRGSCAQAWSKLAPYRPQ